MLDNCNHLDKDNKSAILFIEREKWTGKYPRVFSGYCTICNKTIELSESEYNKINERE